MHHRQPETKEKRSILVGKPAGNDIPTLECVVASLTLARELLMHHKHLERGRARTRRGCLTKSHLRHSTRCSSVLGERLAHTTVSFPTFEEPATGTARGRRGVLSHEVSPPTQRTVLECIARTVRPCSTASFEEHATGTVREQREVVSRGLISDTALVLGETLRSCSTVFPGEPTTGTACEREVISRVLTSNNRPVLECLGRPCSKRTTSRFGRELE